MQLRRQPNDREHYQSALSYPSPHRNTHLDNLASVATTDTDIPTDAPTLSEVVHAICRLKNGKAAGPDGITPELLKFAEEPVSLALHTLFTLVWLTGKVTAEWKEGIIVSLYKGRFTHRLRQLRPIPLLSQAWCLLTFS